MKPEAASSHRSTREACGKPGYCKRGSDLINNTVVVICCQTLLESPDEERAAIITVMVKLDRDLCPKVTKL